MNVVLKPWVWEMPRKKQSAMLSALRGPDTGFCREVKRIGKWLRAAVQHDADPTTSYMGGWPSDWKVLEQELEFCALHYVSHLIEAIALVEFYCDDPHVVGQATELLDWFGKTFHLHHVGAV